MHSEHGHVLRFLKHPTLIPWCTLPALTDRIGPSVSSENGGTGSMAHASTVSAAARFKSPDEQNGLLKASLCRMKLMPKSGRLRKR
jgi:hypothetical protein